MDTTRNTSTVVTRNLVIFLGCAFLWFILDRISKTATLDYFSVDTHSPIEFGNLIQFTLVHNTGAAWGSFAGATNAIAWFTVFLCIAIVAFALYELRSANALEMVGFGLLLAGGLGNLFDRFGYGYVVDMISPLFIDFPTFNVADIGVTCGVIIICIALIMRWLKERSA